MATARDSILPAVRVAVDEIAHHAAHVGYGVLPWLTESWRNVEVERDVRYGPRPCRAHLLDIYRRKDLNGPLPTVLYVHGGAFSMMSKDTHRIMAYLLASRGYQVFNINYRLGPIHRYPEPLKDVMAALCWILDHGQEFGADTSRLAILGESAGANLASALSYCAAHPRPEPFTQEVFERAPEIACVAPLYGLLDLHDVQRFWRDPRKDDRLAAWIKAEIQGTAYSYLGPRARRALQFPLASPLRLFERSAPEGSRPLPPFFTTVGTADPLLPDTIRLCDALQASGTSCELHVFAGEIHAFNVFLWRDAARAQWRALFRFLAQHVGGSEAPAREPAVPPETGQLSLIEASAG